MGYFTRAVDLIAGFLLAAIALITFSEATLRYLFAMQIPDAYTLAGYAQAIAIFWGISSATYAGRNITIDLLWDHLSPRARRAIDVFALLCSALFLGALAWMLIVKVRRAHDGFEITSDLHWPVWTFIAVAALGIAAAFVLALVRAVEVSRQTDGDAP